MTRFSWQPGFVVWHHGAVKPPHEHSCWWHRTHRQTARGCFSNRQPILCMKPAESYCWNLKWAFLHLPNNLTSPRLWSSSSVFPALCGNSSPVRTRMLMDQHVCGQACRILLTRGFPGPLPLLQLLQQIQVFQSSWDSWEWLESFSTEAKSFRPNVWRFLWADCTPLLVTREAAAGLD